MRGPGPGTRQGRSLPGRPAPRPACAPGAPSRPVPARGQRGTRGGRRSAAPGGGAGLPNSRRHGAGRVDGPTPRCTTSAPAAAARPRVRRSHGSSSRCQPRGRRRSHSVSPRRSNRRTRGPSPRAPGCRRRGPAHRSARTGPASSPPSRRATPDGLNPEHEQVAEHHSCSTTRSTYPAPKTSRVRLLLGDPFPASCGGTPAPSSSRCLRQQVRGVGLPVGDRLVVRARVPHVHLGVDDEDALAPDGVYMGLIRLAGLSRPTGRARATAGC